MYMYKLHPPHSHSHSRTHSLTRLLCLHCTFYYKLTTFTSKNNKGSSVFGWKSGSPQPALSQGRLSDACLSSRLSVSIKIFIGTRNAKALFNSSSNISPRIHSSSVDNKIIYTYILHSP